MSTPETPQEVFFEFPPTAEYIVAHVPLDDVSESLKAAIRDSTELRHLAKLAAFGHRLIYWVGHAFLDIVKMESPECLRELPDIDTIRGLMFMTHCAAENLGWEAEELRQQLPDVSQFLSQWSEPEEVDELTNESAAE